MTGRTGTILDYAAGADVDRGEVGGEAKTVSEGRAAEHEAAVLYQGPWHTFGDGFSEHVRRCARALAATGEIVHLRDFGTSARDGIDKEAEADVSSMLGVSSKRYSAGIYQFVYTEHGVRSLMALPGDVGLTGDQMRRLRRSRVLYTVFERDRVPVYGAMVLGLAGSVWVACQRNADVLVECGLPEERVRVIPVPFFDDDPHLSLAGRARSPGPVRFGHFGKWEPRKAQDNILRAFMLAFRPGEAHMYMKTSPYAPKCAGYPLGAPQAVHHLLADPDVRANGWTVGNVGKGVFVIMAKLPAERMVALHAATDVYVTMSRGEGFDMPARDSKLAGNLMVYVPAGGSEDFAADEDIRIEPTGKIPCHPFYGWEASQYLDYDVGTAVLAMREAAARVQAGRQPTAAAPEKLDPMRASVVGQKMRDSLRAIDEELR